MSVRVPLDRSRPPAPGPIRPVRLPRIARAPLPNGLTLVTAPHGDLPLVTVHVVLDAGAVREPAGKAGLARLVTKLLETGTRTRAAAQVAWELEHLGVELETQVSWDTAGLRISGLRERLEPALELFAEILRYPAFPEHEFARLRDQQLADIRQRAKDPRALANDLTPRFIFDPEVPYAHPLIGSSAAVQEFTREDVQRFYADYYRPGAAVLLLVGDIDADTAARLARRHFGDWAGEPPPPVQFPVTQSVEQTTIFIVNRPGAVQSEIRLGHAGIGRLHADYFAVLVMNTILGGSFTSRLNLSLRERHGFTYGARSAFTFRRRPGPFLTQAAVGTEVTAPALQETLRVVTELRDDGPTDTEVATARDYLRGVLPLELETTEQLASYLAELVFFNLPDDYFDQYRDQIAAVTTTDVHRVAREHLHPENMAVVVVGDAEKVREPLEKLGIGPVEVVDS